VTPDRPAASLVATVKDAAGSVVHSGPVDAESGAFAWDGSRADGTRAPAGAYTLSVAALDAGGSAVPVTVQGIGIVRDVVTNGGAVTLGLDGARQPLGALVAVSAAS